MKTKKPTPDEPVDPVKAPGSVKRLADMTPEERAEMERLYTRTEPRPPGKPGRGRRPPFRRDIPKPEPAEAAESDAPESDAGDEENSKED